MNRLTPREEDIIRLKCQKGLTGAGVGAALGISRSTVKNHTTRIFQKLDVGCIAEACDRWARDDKQRARVAAMRAWDV